MNSHDENYTHANSENESPFLKDELLDDETDTKWLVHETSLEAMSPFLNAFESNQENMDDLNREFDDYVRDGELFEQDEFIEAEFEEYRDEDEDEIEMELENDVDEIFEILDDNEFEVEEEFLSELDDDIDDASDEEFGVDGNLYLLDSDYDSFISDDEIFIEDEDIEYNLEENNYEQLQYDIDELDYEDEFDRVAIYDETIIDNELVEFYIPASKLTWKGASAVQLQFMQKVYKAHVARSKKKRKFLPSLRKSQIDYIEGEELRKDAARNLKRMLQAVRSEIDKIDKNIKIKITSGYRSADEQFRLWKKYFPFYYARTKEKRSRMSSGRHGSEAVNYLARFVRGKIAAPGYSKHQSGIAVDLRPTENGITFKNKTKSPYPRNWRRSWFWNWLIKNADHYGFYQNTKINEPWHWVYRGNKNETKFPVIISAGSGHNALSSIIKKGMDTVTSFSQTAKYSSVALKAISNGERDENKITNTVFYAKYPEYKGIKLKRHDPLIKDWLKIRKNIVRPLLRMGNAADDSKVSDIRNDSTLTQSEVVYISYSNGDKKRITPDAVLWLAKMIDAETWGKPTEEDAKAMLWALVQRTAIWKFRKWSWVKMIQAYSQPVNPRWTKTGDKCSKYYQSSFNGAIPNRCSERKVNRRVGNIRKKWDDLHPIARRVVLEFVAGKIPNHIPGAVGWFAPRTWESRQKNGANRKSRMVYHSTIDGNVYFAMNKNPNTINWTSSEVVIKRY